MLLDAGASTHAIAEGVFLTVAQDGHIEIVKMLLDAGFHLHKYLIGNIISDVYNVYSIEIKELLENYQPDDPELIIDELGRTNLMIVAQDGPTYKLREYLTRTPNVNQQDKLGNTALMYAVNANDPMRVQLLFEKGANPLIKNKDGLTAWDYAEQINNPKIIAMLLPTVRMMNRGVPLDIRNIIDLYKKN